MTATPSPYVFAGGPLTDYRVGTGPSGTYFTEHLPTGQKIQSIAPALKGATDLIQAATFGLNLVNLGLGIYTAYQARAMRSELAEARQEITARLSVVQRTLNAHGRVLEILCAGQEALADRLSLLHREMHEGFDRVISEIGEEAARRRREEFARHTILVATAYERFARTLPSAVEAPALRQRADELAAWLGAQLESTPGSAPSRLPLVAGMVFAVRARSDAQLAMGAEYAELVESDLQSVEALVRSSAFAVVEGQTPWAVAVQLRDVLYQYLLLLRGVQRGRYARASAPDGMFVGPTDLAYEDGLDLLRQLGAKPNGAKYAGDVWLPLRTLEEYNWYARVHRLDAATFKVASCTDYCLGDLFARLGHPDPRRATIASENLPALREAVTIDLDYRTSASLSAHFGWPQPPKLRWNVPAASSRWAFSTEAPPGARRVEFRANGLLHQLWWDTGTRRATLRLGHTAIRGFVVEHATTGTTREITRILDWEPHDRTDLPQALEVEGTGGIRVIAIYANARVLATVVTG